MTDLTAIYSFVGTIPVGRVMSYGEVGQAVGVSARAVGRAMRLLAEGVGAGEPVPWHRVVGADGYLRTARRSPELGRHQQALLASEGVGFDARGCVAPEFFLSFVAVSE